MRALAHLARRIGPLRAIVEERDALRERVRELRGAGDAGLDPRTLLAARYIRGAGIEIGAAHLPLPVKPGVSVTYVDLVDEHELRRRWPEMVERPLVHVDLVDDAERLAGVGDGTQDFVVANHLLEHTLDPLGTLENLHAKLRPGGILFLALPDKRRTFDAPRPVTPWEHLLAEHETGGAGFREAHTEEYVRLAEGREDGVSVRVAELMASQYRIHYHVWTWAEILELFVRAARELGLGLEVVACLAGEIELEVVARRL